MRWQSSGVTDTQREPRLGSLANAGSELESGRPRRPKMNRLNQLALQLVYLPVTVLMVAVDEIGKMIISARPGQQSAFSGPLADESDPVSSSESSCER